MLLLIGTARPNIADMGLAGSSLPNYFQPAVEFLDGELPAALSVETSNSYLLILFRFTRLILLIISFKIILVI
jgi:hypothetical protein